MDPATIMTIIGIVAGAMSLVRQGLLTAAEFKQVTDKYGALPATAENIEAMRLELLDKAQIQQAVDDPRIRAILAADGIDPESLRIPA